MDPIVPQLETLESNGVSLITDPWLRARSGIVVAFSERRGGASNTPFDSLDLAAHVGDDPSSVDENRRRVMRALDLEPLTPRLVTAEQVHGSAITWVGEADVGRGALATAQPGPVPATDALATTEPGIPLLMLYADCVPVIIVSTEPAVVGVVHAGWRGALAGIAGKTAMELSARAGTAASDLLAYIGPHIGPCCYQVDETLLSHFVHKFGTICAVDGRLDLEAAVRADLMSAGVRGDAIVSAGCCTNDQVDRFFSYRASRVTGRHGALAAITKAE